MKQSTSRKLKRIGREVVTDPLTRIHQVEIRSNLKYLLTSRKYLAGITFSRAGLNGEHDYTPIKSADMFEIQLDLRDSETLIVRIEGKKR